MRRTTLRTARWLRDHSLSVALATIWLTLLFLSWLLMRHDLSRWLNSVVVSHAGGSFNALLLVLLTKWWRERGSTQSD